MSTGTPRKRNMSVVTRRELGFFRYEAHRTNLTVRTSPAEALLPATTVLRRTSDECKLLTQAWSHDHRETGWFYECAAGTWARWPGKVLRTYGGYARPLSFGSRSVCLSVCGCSVTLFVRYLSSHPEELQHQPPPFFNSAMVLKTKVLEYKKRSLTYLATNKVWSVLGRLSTQVVEMPSLFIY